jgi:hypothetical protein
MASEQRATHLASRVRSRFLPLYGRRMMGALNFSHSSNHPPCSESNVPKVPLRRASRRILAFSRALIGGGRQDPFADAHETPRRTPGQLGVHAGPVLSLNGLKASAPRIASFLNARTLMTERVAGRARHSHSTLSNCAVQGVNKILFASMWQGVALTWVFEDSNCLVV